MERQIFLYFNVDTDLCFTSNNFDVELFITNESTKNSAENLIIHEIIDESTADITTKKNTADLTIQEIYETMKEHSYATLNNIPSQNMCIKIKSKFLRPFLEIFFQNNF